MADYQLTSGSGVIRTADTAFIPNDPDNRDWQSYQEWLGAGNTPDPYVAPPAPVPNITRRQFVQQMAVQGIIAQSDAIGLVSNGTMPAALASVIAKLPTGEQFAANMFILSGDDFVRSSQLVNDIAAAYGWTAAQTDAFFKAAAAL